jgi:hypothetical protein
MTDRSEGPEGLFQQLDDLIADIIDQFASQGYGAEVVIETLQEALSKRKRAYDRDLDPAEDVEEPANDWPGAESSPDGTRE